MAIPSVTLLDFRRRAAEILERVRKGESMLLTYRGRPAVRLEPVRPERADPNDAFYSLSTLDETDAEASELSNDTIDRLVYGP